MGNGEDQKKQSKTSLEWHNSCSYKKDRSATIGAGGALDEPDPWPRTTPNKSTPLWTYLDLGSVGQLEVSLDLEARTLSIIGEPATVHFVEVR